MMLPPKVFKVNRNLQFLAINLSSDSAFADITRVYKIHLLDFACYSYSYVYIILCTLTVFAAANTEEMTERMTQPTTISFSSALPPSSSDGGTSGMIIHCKNRK